MYNDDACVDVYGPRLIVTILVGLVQDHDCRRMVERRQLIDNTFDRRLVTPDGVELGLREWTEHHAHVGQVTRKVAQS